ncbi:hypothetical protein JXQ31_11730 [candidate division KSB1 bacterium]|nr:hypothetical protein [candidate division KSB1 bacterium]
MLNRVAILDTGYDSYEYEQKLFTDAGFNLEIFYGERHDREGKRKFAQDAVGLLVRWTQINEDFLRAVPHLKAVVRYGVGYDNVDLKAANRYHVKVANVQGYANHSVSDHAIAMMYACARALPRGQQSLKTKFSAPPVKQIFEFHDKTLGIIGLGRIGGTLCQKVRPLFKTILAADPYITDERFENLGAKRSGLDELLGISDVITIHCNLTEETTNLINSEKVQLMRKKPVLINTARGPVLNEDDLFTALQDGKLHSVGLDVFCDEPPQANRDELLAHPQVIATGHYAWYSTNAAAELQKRAADNLLSMLRGSVPKDCLNP